MCAPGWASVAPGSQNGDHVPLRDAKIPLVIDDFHYLEREIQGSLVRALKSLIFEEQIVILLAIPHRRFDAVRVEKEMTGRVAQVGVPPWEASELLEIPGIGFPLLNMTVPSRILVRFADEALGSPHLMQEFCKQLCYSLDIEETCRKHFNVPQDVDVQALFRKVAEGTSRVIFDKLAKGPRQRSDRLQRPLARGGEADIYTAVLQAIARLKPGMVTIEYEDIRASLREVLSDTLPQAHEVSRVLEHMAKISADDEASVPVIDFEKKDRRLHITDPFFAFFLKWGVS